jgi:hypothetical protein
MKRNIQPRTKKKAIPNVISETGGKLYSITRTTLIIASVKQMINDAIQIISVTFLDIGFLEGYTI